MARPKGVANRDTQKLMDLAESLGVDPFEVILHFAKGDFESLGYTETQTKIAPDGSTFEVLTIEPETRLKAAIKAAEFMYPKRKSIEINSQAEKSLTLNYANPKGA